MGKLCICIQKKPQLFSVEAKKATPNLWDIVRTTEAGDMGHSAAVMGKYGAHDPPRSHTNPRCRLDGTTSVCTLDNTSICQGKTLGRENTKVRGGGLERNWADPHYG